MPAAQTSPWPSAPDRLRQRDEKREALLRAAVRAFNDKGFHAASLDEVAASLNVSKPTIYYYLGNKDEILFECVRRGLDRLHAAAQAAERAGGPGLARLRALLLDYALAMTGDFGICVSRTADHELSAESRARFRALKREIDAMIRRVIEDGMADGSIRPGDARMMTFTATGALNWIPRWYRPDGPMTAEEVAQGAVGTLLSGFCPHPAG